MGAHRMIDYDAFLSQAGRILQQSAIRKMGTVLADAADVVSFAPGYPAPDTFAWPELASIAAELLDGRDGTVLQYGPTRGHPPLLEGIRDLLAARGIVSDLKQLVVTTGSQQGLDLVARVLLDPGDVALVELPSYTGAIAAFRNAQATLAGVRQESDGIDLAHLDDVLGRLRAEGRRVRFLYVVPNFQNPTGLLIAREKRRRLVEWAARHELLIVEDDPYGDLYFEDSATAADTRPIKADDGEGRVVYLSSFSKTLAPGLRVAWMAAPAPLAARFELAKQASDLCSGAFDQRIVHEAWKRGVLARQVPRLRAHYQRKRDVMTRAMQAALGDVASWPAPRGGFFLWVTLPACLDTEALLARAQRHGVIYVVGSAFFVDGSGRHIARLSFSAPSPERIDEGVRRLAVAVREEIDQRRLTVDGS
jgi:2-aminoadipate transaminase